MPGVAPFTTRIGVSSLKPPTAVSEFQVKRTELLGFTSRPKINLERDKGSAGASLITSAAGSIATEPSLFAVARSEVGAIAALAVATAIEDVVSDATDETTALAELG